MADATGAQGRRDPGGSGLRMSSRPLSEAYTRWRTLRPIKR